MKKSMTKRVLAAATAAATAMSLVACGGNTAPAPVENTPAEPAEEVTEEVTEVVDIKSLTEEIMDNIGTVYEQYGIEIMTVEVKKLDLPDDNKQAVYTRMIS